MELSIFTIILVVIAIFLLLYYAAVLSAISKWKLQRIDEVNILITGSTYRANIEVNLGF